MMGYAQIVQEEITRIMSTPWAREHAVYRAKMITLAIRMGVL